MLTPISSFSVFLVDLLPSSARDPAVNEDWSAFFAGVWNIYAARTLTLLVRHLSGL